jgi:hypothetical protein
MGGHFNVIHFSRNGSVPSLKGPFFDLADDKQRQFSVYLTALFPNIGSDFTNCA